jgi:RNA polymerase sigma-70 factor (ECF subfamily)
MEKSAFEQKARTWREKALNVSRHYGAGEDMAEDIAQDVMLRLWQMHDELERFRSVEAVVTLMAKHTLRDLQRRRTAESLEEATIVSLTSSPQEELEAKENEEWLIMKLSFIALYVPPVLSVLCPLSHTGSSVLKWLRALSK